MSAPLKVQVERAAYLAAAPFLAVAPNAPEGAASSVVLGAGLLGVAGTMVAVKSGVDVGAKILLWSPLTTALAADVAAAQTPGMGWDWLIAAGWAAVGCLLHPLSGTTRPGKSWRRPAPAPIPTRVPAGPAEPVDDADAYTREVRKLWERAGAPGRTHIVRVDPHKGTVHDLTALLRAVEPGRPITGLTEAAVAAAFAVAVEDVELAPVARQSGRQSGPGWLEVRITPDAGARRRENPTAKEQWADKVGCNGGGAPGSRLVEVHRNKDRGATHYRAAMDDGLAVPRIDLAQVCRGMGHKFDDARMFLMTADDEFLVSMFDEPPLSRTFHATRELLTPDKDGMFVCGYSFTGQPVRNMIYQRDKNAACHNLILGVTRSGKTQYFAINMAAQGLGGGVNWLASVQEDEKTGVLGRYIDRQGADALYMVRALRAVHGLCAIRAKMPWLHDGQPHDYKPGDPRCPYRLLNVYLDEYMSASKDPVYGDEIVRLAEAGVVMSLKYGIGLDFAGQSPFATDGFSTQMKANIKQNSRPIVFNMGGPGATRKALEGVVTDVYNLPVIPARYAPGGDGSAIDRAIRGEAEPENGVSTGGVAILVGDNGQPVLMRSLYADFDTDLSDLFPEIHHLSDHEIAELDAQGLWGDWNRPDEDLEDQDDLDDWGHDDRPRPRKGGPRTGRNGQGRGGRSARDALAEIRRFTDA